MDTHDDGELTMQAARDRYFARNGFGADGGYTSKWVDFELGPIPLPFPNTAGRVRAVRYHDLHHVVTGYATDALGEFEISAWELGAGCRGYLAAWQLNLGGVFAGAISIPGRTFRAFARGLRSQSLYGRSYAELLAAKVGDVRREVLGPYADAPPTLRDRALFAATVGAGLVVGSITFAAFVPLIPVGLAASLVRKLSAPRGDAATT